MSKNKISIIVPALNEEGNITELARRIDRALRLSDLEYELIMIDDYSSDDTWQEMNEIAKKYPVRPYKKKGHQGKAYAIMEGLDYVKSEYVGFIDADLQYPPEAIPMMVEKLQKEFDVIVANRIERDVSFFRSFPSKVFRLFFSRVLHGMNFDVQAGLKVFRAQVAKEVKIDPTGWTFDMEFLINAKNYGYKIGSHDIHFDERKRGISKICFFKQTFEIGWNAVKLKFKGRKPLFIQSENEESMLGSGVAHRKKRFITHTSLKKENSALQTFALWQKIFMFLVVSLMFAGLLYRPLLTGIIFLGAITAFYFIDMVFSLILVSRSLKRPPEIRHSHTELAALPSGELPLYTILCPLYKEANVLPDFLSSISKLEWPKDKLDVMLLLEEDDKETIAKAKQMDLQEYVRIVVVPHSMPKTKPKACNYGLCLAKGEYVVIYDAEDQPDPWQLKKAYMGFLKSPEVGCFQAKLNYYNPNQNMLTRMFTAEYSLWFDVILPGLQSINTSIPLGGTSNHFRTKDLLDLEGWDPFNVTEDCDLGIRIFKRGYKTAIIDSTTLEEANSNAKNWLRQRSRWIKGYMQTYLVNMRRPLQFIRENGVHALIFQLVVGAKIAFIIINPVLWIATFSYFVFYFAIGPIIEDLYPTAILYMGATSMIFGNFMYIYFYMIGLAKRGHWHLIKYVYLVPVYWAMVSVAGVIATYQLFIKPHFWEKTNHGLHKKPSEVPVPIPTGMPYSPELISAVPSKKQPIESKPLSDIASVPLIKRILISPESFFIAAIILSNFLNFVFSAYLGRILSYEQLGLVILVNTLWYLTMIFIAAFSTTINHKTAFLKGAQNESSSASFLYSSVLRALRLVLPLSLIWLIAVPAISGFFNIEDYLIMLLVTPIFPFAIIGHANIGYLKGTFNFIKASFVLLSEAVIKLFLALIFSLFGASEFIYISIPVSIVVAALLSVFMVRNRLPKIANVEYFEFPKKFFFSALMANISAIIFLSLDIILVKHFMSPRLAGEYALLSLVGKMIFFSGTLPNMFMMTFVSRNEGRAKDSRRIFRRIYYSTIAISALTILVFGVFGYVSIPFLLGAKSSAIVMYLPVYASAIVLFALANVIVSYHLAKRQYSFTAVSLIGSLVMTIGIILNHSSISAVVLDIFMAGFTSFASVGLLHLTEGSMRFIKRNLDDFKDAFLGELPFGVPAEEGKKNILILNWRDGAHVFAGGAETYIEEIAKLWVRDGHRVTIFCGNDSHSKRSEIKDGMEIIRRGGFYFVYIWAFVYYMIRFRGKYDLIIDCQNGIPFFSPIYAKEPVYCLMHHVHQEVFTKSLSKPLAVLARFLEKGLMPLVYRRIYFITVSESSREAMLELGIGKEGIAVVNPGVDLDFLVKGEKSPSPMVLYFGRLKEYKSIDILINAFSIILKRVPKAKLVIAGTGEDANNLRRLAVKLGIISNVDFTGRVTEEEKRNLLQQAWVSVNPSFMEGWGITTIEANACATPVVASNVPGLRDSVRNPHTGFLVAYGDVNGFAMRITQILTNDNLRQKLSISAIQWSRNFDWEKSSKKFLDYIEQHNYFDDYKKIFILKNVKAK